MVSRFCIVTFYLFTIFAINLKAQTSAHKTEVNLIVDYESAEEIIHLLNAKKVTEEQLNHAAQTYGNKLLIKKVSGSIGGDENVFKQTLKEIITTGTVKGRDPYAWKDVKAVLPIVKKLIARIRTNQKDFVMEIESQIQAYTPVGLPAQNLHACLLLGGGAVGFVIGNDGAFSVALQKFGSDYEGLKTVMVHELYHAVQEVGQNQRKKNQIEKPAYNTKATYYLCYNLWAEGTAEKVGDFNLISSPGDYSKKNQERLKKNADRLLVNFRLMDVLLYKMYNDTSASYSALYDIAFTTVYEEAGYSVGYEMAKQLEQFRGKESISALTLQDPLEFMLQYIQLYHEHPKEVLYRFDASTEAIIEKIKVWKDRI